MAEHAIAPEALKDKVAAALGALAQSVTVARGEVTLIVAAEHYLQAMTAARCAGCRFEQLIDLCGVDYSTYGDGVWEGPRFAVVSHLLSVS
jgi:NADH-quinone oxidoreductase subunit C